MDHHCDWVDNCIGATNQKNFFLFLIFAIFQCVLTFILFFNSFVLWIYHQKTNFNKDIFSFGNLLNLILCFFSVFFFFFCCDFCFDQYEGILENQTTVESYKDVWGKKVSNFTKNIFLLFISSILYIYVNDFIYKSVVLKKTSLKSLGKTVYFGFCLSTLR